MKVKTLACLCALAAISAFGTEAVTSGNTFGVLKVTCSAQKVIIATPWVKCGDANSSVSVSNLVMTSGLVEGDSVLLYQNGAFKGWSINASGNWQSMPVTVSGTTYDSGSNAAIARGEAFWFVKASYSEPYDLYLYGQEAASEATATSSITGGTSASPAYSLVASPKITSTGTNDINVARFDFTPDAADEIRIPRGNNKPDVVYTYKSGSWGTPTSREVGSTGRYVTTWTAGCTIPAGMGFWYLSKGGSGTITW